jgi:hypothetical protein
MKEWNMDTVESNYFWRRLKSIGRVFTFLDTSTAQIIAIVLLALTASISELATLSSGMALGMSTIAAVVSIILSTATASDEDRSHAWVEGFNFYNN